MKNIDFPNDIINNLNELVDLINGTSDDICVTVLSGKYYGSLNFNNLKCKSLTICGDSDVSFSGAQKLNCTFKRYSGSIIQTDFPTGLNFDRLKLNGRQMILARYPNYSDDKLLGGTVSLNELNERAKQWRKPSTGYLHSLHKSEWGGNCYKIRGYKNNRLDLEWIGNNNRGDKLLEKSVVCENIFEELDSLDEWFYDDKDGKLYIYCDGDFEKTAEVEIFASQNILTIENCRNTEINIKNITFCDTDRAMFKSSWDRYLRSDWAFNKSSAVKISESANIRFTSCNFENLGSNAVGIFDFADNIQIDDCRFVDCLSNGVLILGSPDSTYCTSSWEKVHRRYIENKKHKGHKTENFPRNIKVENSYFYNLGTVDKQSAAVCLSLCKNVIVDGCTIHHLPRAGINICENSFGGNAILNCDIFNCVRETGDHGPFNSWGRDRYWSLFKFDTTGKFGKYKKKYALYDMEEQNIIRHNRISGDRGFGIDLDDGSSNYIIEDNLCFGLGIKLREGFYRTVRNNIIIGAQLDLHTTFCGNDDRIYSNIIVNKKPLNVIILNSGYTTDIYNNYFVNSDKSAQNEKIIRGKKNDFISANSIDIVEGKFSFENFKDFSRDFGKIGCPKAPFSEINTSQETCEFNNSLGNFSSLDEGLRSATGAPDFNGIYVKSIPNKSVLSKAGVKNGDVLILINGENPKDMLEKGSLSVITQVTVVRQQKITRLK